MIRYILRRLLWIAATLIVVSLLTFALVFAVGDPAVMLTPTRPGQAPKPELVAFIRRQYGLDQPMYVAYVATWATCCRQSGRLPLFPPPGGSLPCREALQLTPASGRADHAASLAGPSLAVLAAAHRNTFLDHDILLGLPVLDFPCRPSLLAMYC